MSRLAWIHANLWPRAVSAAQARRAAGRAPEGAVEQALAAGAADEAWALVQGYDPTPGHEALAWLLRRWTDGTIRGEDLAKARDTIFVWSKTKQRLPVGARDLGQYKALAELDRVLMDAGVDFDVVLDGGAASGKAVKREHADRIREVESIVLLDPSSPGSDGWTIAVPLTMDAARWWGKGTRWCTAAREDKNNAFEKYDKDGPLIVFVAPDGRKWQWHPKTNQMADAADTMVTFDRCPAFGKWPELLTCAVMQNGRALDHVPDALLTEALCLVAVQQDGWALNYVPEALRTESLCLAAVRQNGRALEDVPEELRTEAMCLAAVQQNGWALQYVPEALRTESLCLMVVEYEGGALYHVPDALRTEAICLAAVQQAGWSLSHVPYALQTESLCLMAVTHDGEALKYVIKALQTESLCLTAVQQNGLALCHVPIHLRTESLCLAAVKQTGKALQYVPEHLRTEAMCMMAVPQYGGALCYVPKPLRTEVLYLAMVEQAGWALEYVPKALRTEAMCLTAVKQDGWALEYVPDDLRTEAMCQTAVRKRGGALCYVPDALRTESLCLSAMQQDGEALGYIPESLRTESLCLMAMEQTSQALKFIPEALRDRPAIVAVYDVHLARKREERLTGPLADLRSVFDVHVAATAATSEICLVDFGDRLRRSRLVHEPEVVTP